ncbi:hypothetical protein CHC179_04390 [Helicobacter pylori]
MVVIRDIKTFAFSVFIAIGQAYIIVVPKSARDSDIIRAKSPIALFDDGEFFY